MQDEVPSNEEVVEEIAEVKEKKAKTKVIKKVRTKRSMGRVELEEQNELEEYEATIKDTRPAYVYDLRDIALDPKPFSFP